MSVPPPPLLSLLASTLLRACESNRFAALIAQLDRLAN